MRSKGKTGEFKEFYLVDWYFLRGAVRTTLALTPISCINFGTLFHSFMKREIELSDI